MEKGQLEMYRVPLELGSSHVHKADNSSRVLVGRVRDIGSLDALLFRTMDHLPGYWIEFAVSDDPNNPAALGILRYSAQLGPNHDCQKHSASIPLSSQQDSHSDAIMP